MGFAALRPRYVEPWLVNLVGRLLENDRPTLALLRRNPFAERPPTFVRAQLYRYRFTTRAERHQSGAWWSRELLGEFLSPVALTPGHALAPAREA
jgi:hypothetical protein